MSYRARILTEFSGKEVRKHGAVVVENWKSKSHGRVRRLWLKTFSETERKAATKIYQKLRRYEHSTGYPEWIKMSWESYNLLKSMAAFFAGWTEWR